jgi:branched-chain amino acid transport system substrate-binding protein
MRSLIKVLGVAGALLASVALAACGSSSKSSSTPTSAAGAGSSSSAAPTPSPKGTAFNLGAICSCSGVQAAALARVKEVSTVWADSVNAAGGVNGHPVKITVMDDSGNPATALQDVKQLVQVDHIQALVGDGSLADGSFQTYIANAGVPVIGGFSPSIPFLTNPDFFATGATLPVSAVGVAALGKAAGKKKLGVMYCSETPLCAQLIPIAKGAAGLSGLGFTSVAISGTAPSYAAPCLTMKGNGVDALFVADNGSIVKRVVDGCAQQSYRPAIVSTTTTADPTWLTDPNFNGALLSSTNPGYTDASNSGIAAFLAALKKYDPSLLTSPQFGYDTLYPWLAGKLFQAAATAGALTPASSPAQVKTALYKIKDDTLGGLAPPITITPGKPVFVPCYYGVTIKNGAYQALDGGKPTCLTATQATALLSALKGA